MSNRNNDNTTNESNNNNNDGNSIDDLVANAISGYLSRIYEPINDSKLHDAIRERNRNLTEILQIIEQQPNTVQHKNKSNQYPLHFACQFCDKDEYNPIFVTLIEMYPIAAAEKDYLDNYPLHTALENHQSDYVIKLLLSAYPLAVECMNTGKKYPLHIACKYNFSETIILTLIDMYPTAAEHKDIHQHYPLHATCGRKGFSVKVAMQLLDIYPDAGKCYTSYKKTPLDLACGNCNKQSEKLLLRLINIFPDAINFKSGSGSYPLHSACSNSHNLSMNMLLKLFPVHHVHDLTGNTPLSNLLCYARFRIIPELPICQFHMEQNWKKLLSSALQLIDAYPNQAMCKHRCKQRYPLHLACKQGVDERIILSLIHINLLAVNQKCDKGKYPLDYAKQSNLTSVAHVLEDLMNKDNDELENRVGIPSIVTSHDIKNIYRFSIMEWVQCNTPSYIQGKYTQPVPLSKTKPFLSYN